MVCSAVLCRVLYLHCAVAGVQPQISSSSSFPSLSNSEYMKMEGICKNVASIVAANPPRHPPLERVLSQAIGSTAVTVGQVVVLLT